MKFVLTKIPVVEDLLVLALQDYIQELRWAEMFPNHTNINLSNDHPFEELLGGTGDIPNLFPSVTVVSANDAESSGMAKGWKEETLQSADMQGFDREGWYVTEGALADLVAALAVSDVYGLSHTTVWKDSVSFEIWSENAQVKNDLYSLLVGFLTGPKIMQLKQERNIVIPSSSINGQRSGYYNFDFGRVLYGGRITFTADYQVIQAVYDSEIGTLAEIRHTYQEVLNG